MRISFVIIMLIAVSMATIMPSGFLPMTKVDCIQDSLFEWTAGANTYLADHVQTKHAFMIIAGLMMDVMVVTVLYEFAFKGTTWRLPIAFILNHALRMITLVRSF